MPAHTAQRASIEPERLRAIQGALRERGLDGWLLYDYHATNPIAGRVLGLRQPLSRRYFALLPAEGRPVAVAHSLERAPWTDWPGAVRPYFTWQELESVLAEALTPGQRIAVEYSEGDRLPQLDRVPAGVLDLIREAGVHPTGSDDLVTLFASAWSADELQSHRRTARTLAETARAAFLRVGEALRDGEEPGEWETKAWILERLEKQNLQDADAIVAVGSNSADGHYEPTKERSAPIEPDNVLLIDLWGREPGSVFADQTWMGFTGARVPERVAEVWNVVRRARDAAVEHLRENWGGEPLLTGSAVDRVSRAVVREAGFARNFNHRTGHSIDSELHGLGPNIDSVETRDERALMPGIGFSIEPGIYLKGEFGVRSEIDVYLSENGPEVTPPAPQTEVFPLLDEKWIESNR